MKKKKILFVCPYPFDEAPSQRFRFEQYFPALDKEGFSYQLAPFLNLKAWRILYRSGNNIQKLVRILLAYFKRMGLLFQLKSYDLIFIHREATPMGPPFFEWAVRFLWRKKIIYDFDDAIWLNDPNEKGSLKAFIKWKSKVKDICKWSYKVSCGNEYLAKFALQFNPNVVINPTTIDTEYHKKSERPESNIPVIGWTGTHSTLPYLKLIIPTLDQLFNETEFQLLVISNQKPDFDVHYMHFIPWQKSTEIPDLNKIDIGIMPLTDDIWSQGKCGFKLLQYMAIKKPVVASPVGVNKKLLTESQAGFEARNEEDWLKHLGDLLKKQPLRMKLGNNGYNYIKKHYSTESNKSNFISLMQ